MMQVLQSAVCVDLLRYRRSWGLWLLLVIAAAGARFMVARDDGSGLQVSVGNHLPVLDWPTLGVSLGVIVATALLPVGWMYLRSNTTRVQPWQVVEVTAAPRVAMALGHFAADFVVLTGMLVVLTAAGAFIGLLIIPNQVRFGDFAAALWLIAIPPLALVAGLRSLLDALPVGRRAGGDVLFLVIWLASLTAPLAVAGQPASFASDMWDMAGFMRPLAGPSPASDSKIAIGSTKVASGRVPLDVKAGLRSEGYMPARLMWLTIAAALSVLGALVYWPHTQRRQRQRPQWLDRLMARGPPAPAALGGTPAAFVRTPFIGMAVTEFQLIGAGWVFLLLAALSAIAGTIGDFRHIGSPAELLLLVFGLSAQAGRGDSRGMRALTTTASISPLARRLAFVLAGVGWALIMAVPSAAVRLSTMPLVLAAEVGGAAAFVAMLLAWLTGSGFAARILLLLIWYGYLST